jgi:hypothetical protein
MLLAQKQVRNIAGPSGRVWEEFSNWFRQKRPFFGLSGGLVDENAQSEFVAAGVTGDADVLTRFIEQVIGYTVAVGNATSTATHCLQSTPTPVACEEIQIARRRPSILCISNDQTSRYFRRDRRRGIALRGCNCRAVPGHQ